MNLQETYNFIASDWHRDHQKDSWWIEGTDHFISLLQNKDLVLDAGCAGGVKSRYLIQKGLRVVGIDFSEKLIEIAKREVPGGSFFVLNIRDANKLDYVFDGIFIQAVLLHLPKREILEVLKNLLKNLKLGGHLYIAVKEKRPKGVEEEIQTENDYGYSYQRFFSYYSQKEMELYLKTLGLEVVFSDVKKSGNTNWIQVIGKKL